MAPSAPALSDPGPTAWARLAALLLEHVAARGADRGALLEASRLDAESWRDPDARIPLLGLYDLIEAAVDATGDACLGLHFAQSLKLSDLDALGFLMITSPTFGVALQRIISYQSVWAEGERFVLTLDGDDACVSYRQYGDHRPAHAQMVQMGFCDFVANGGRIIPGLRFDRVRVRETKPSYADEYRRVLGVPVEFGAPADEVWFPARLLEMPLPEANQAYNEFFDRYVREQLQRVPPSEGLTARVRRHLQELIPERRIQLKDVAERLHMSPRTLQRRLRDEHTSLQHELDEVRREQALYLLDGGVAIAELAWLLGSAEPSAFHHAFKRWTGTTPSLWRARGRS